MIIVILTIFVLLLVSAFLYSHHKNSQQVKTQRQGLKRIREIKKLITLVQKHRGLTLAWLNGDNSIEVQLNNLKKDINSLNNFVLQTDICHNDRWISYYDHWQRLLTTKLGQSLLNSYDQHCLMVKNLSYLLEDTAENHLLTADYITDMPNIGYAWRELIVTVENIGQSRAIGTGVTAKKHCSSVDKIRLNFLTLNMGKISRNTFDKLSYSPDEKIKHETLLNLAKNKMDNLIKTIQEQLINSTHVEIDHHHYFKLATDTIEEFDNIFEHQMKQLSKAI